MASGIAWSKYIASRLAPYVPTPEIAITQALRMAQLRRSDVFFDLGSGDGRVVLAAAERAAASVGIEIDEDLVTRARKSAAVSTTAQNVAFVCGDVQQVVHRGASTGSLFDRSDPARHAPSAAPQPHAGTGAMPVPATRLTLADATIVYMYMGDWSSEQLLPLVRDQLRGGSRIVTCGYPLEGAPWDVVKTRQALDLDMYLYELPEVHGAPAAPSVVQLPPAEEAQATEEASTLAFAQRGAATKRTRSMRKRTS